MIFSLIISQTMVSLSSPANGKFFILFSMIQWFRYYFGVGGGVKDFLHLISQPRSTLNAHVVRVFDDGQSNIREIVEVARKERR
jgi:hypothetical protein